MIKTIYSIPAPDSLGAKIEVYGDPRNAWYEFRIIEKDGRVIRDTGTEGNDAFQGRQYGQAEIALRDALMHATDIDIDAIRYRSDAADALDDTPTARLLP